MDEVRLSLLLQSGNVIETASVPICHTVIAGWTGRDLTAVERHIEELAALGVKRPTSIPSFYRIASARVTTHSCIEVLGDSSSGEVEFVLFEYAGKLWLAVGSDHTDRSVETFSVEVSKQICDKPIARVCWLFDEVAPHWDSLILRSRVGVEQTLYQEGSVATLLRPADLISRLADGGTGPEKTLMFCGTLPVIGGIRPAPEFAFELDDPILGRKICHQYQIRTLPMCGQLSAPGSHADEQASY